MATDITTLFTVLVAWCVVTSAEVISFKPDMLGSPDPETDLLLVVAPSTSPSKDALHQALQSVDGGNAGLKRRRGLVVSQCIDCASADQLLTKYNLKHGDLPVAFIFPFKSETTRSGIFSLHLNDATQPLPAIVNFIKSFDAGKLQPWVRSLPKPTAKEQQGPVRIVVGSTFEKEVIDGDKHMLMLIYSDEDRAAKPLLPILERIGEKLDPKKSPLQAAKFDNDANDYPPSINVPIESLPQLMMFRKNDGGDPDIFPPNRPQTDEGVLDWLREVLPDRNYGLDQLFSRLARKGKQDILEGDKQMLRNFGSGHAHAELEEI